ncbi:hypothetical protein [Muribaculum intestinale]|uniref:Uncharacterized protein n=1 Tax=Muribaculum intestinale TaxID=1796646 RepID=A0A4S2FRC3_9BACT|nr:hypothetical protein [Muribaculum intestinale]MYM13346.1 hypothetical protein [Muribaculum intestinale]TGY71725.1 hypothetical protein E5333_11125 [Muribaculum intestinale]
MAALDDILNGGTSSIKPVQVSPPPIDSQLNEAVNTVGSKPVAQPTTTTTTTPQPEAKQTPGTDGQEQQENRQEQTEDKKRLSYVEMFEALNPQKPETAEERAKREKREKREAMLAAVGDGISALSNLFFTTQYAPNAYDPSKGMSAKARERWDKLRLEREANRRAYSDGYLRALAMDEAGEREDRNWRHTLERERIADERYEIKAAQDKAMADLNEQLRRHQITAAEHKAEQERIAAQFAEETEKLKQENLRAGVRQKDAAAGASYASANASNAKAEETRGGNGRGTKRTLKIGEKTYSYSSPEDYDRAVEGYAKQYGVPLYMAYQDGWDGRKPKWTTRRKPIAQIAAEVEAKATGKASKDDFSQYEVGDADDFSQYEKK